jgi:hypothetical protein
LIRGNAFEAARLRPIHPQAVQAHAPPVAACNGVDRGGTENRVGALTCSASISRRWGGRCGAKLQLLIILREFLASRMTASRLR